MDARYVNNIRVSEATPDANVQEPTTMLEVLSAAV